MSFKKDIKSIFAVVVVGLMAGILGSGLYGWFFSDSTESSPSAVGASSTAHSTEAFSRQNQLSSLVGHNNAARLAALENKVNSLNGETDVPDVPSGEPMTPEEIVEQRRKLFDRWADRLDALDREPVDPGWANRSSDLFTTDVKKLEEIGNFSLKNVECHSVTCAAHVEFPSFRHAKDGYTSLLHAQYEMNCEREIILPDPEDPSVPYAATMIYSNCIEDQA